MKFSWLLSRGIGLLLYFVCGLAFAGSSVSGLRVWSGPDNTRIVLDLSAAAEFSHFNLSGPHRLVVDLKSTKMAAELSKVALSGKLVKKVRASTPKNKGDYRMVVELSQAVTPVVFALKPTGNYGHRLVIDLPDKVGKAETKKQQQQISKTKTKQQLSGDRDIIIAIDAGHGGEDPGAIGNRKTYEKNVTLAIAKRVQRLINQEPGLKAVLVRQGDYFVNLNKRSQIARQNKADFLVSIHADGFTSSQPKGASVWVVSNRRAKSEVGRHLEDHEAESDLLGGVGEVMGSVENDAHLNFALIDMQMDYSMNTAFEVAKQVLGELGKVTSLHKKRPEHASLAVLKSPDIPSILVEAGFITNHKEEKLLKSGNHQEKIAKAVVKGIKTYYSAKPLAGTLYAQTYGVRKHTVQRGDSLSVLAARYNTSVNGLKKANKLSSNVLKIGQVLTIPNS
ncbi:N-acetylmuramoyl-L-alanine amidase [Agarivorans sp. MS3-6]|uniref:N-acetylmuramoyl-L-alanine amidase n=1 Tax=Agarivorans sp. TSD2052 TaxID=2937286 RepID=UPI00273A6524|nr:N-acetylmuramoyl-L-alanine amidase [Agarivorans sp. TSD2052]